MNIEQAMKWFDANEELPVLSRDRHSQSLVDGAGVRFRGGMSDPSLNASKPLQCTHVETSRNGSGWQLVPLSELVRVELSERKLPYLANPKLRWGDDVLHILGDDGTPDAYLWMIHNDTEAVAHEVLLHEYRTRVKP